MYRRCTRQTLRYWLENGRRERDSTRFCVFPGTKSSWKIVIRVHPILMIVINFFNLGLFIFISHSSFCAVNIRDFICDTHFGRRVWDNEFFKLRQSFLSPDLI